VGDFFCVLLGENTGVPWISQPYICILKLKYSSYASRKERVEVKFCVFDRVWSQISKKKMVQSAAVLPQLVRQLFYRFLTFSQKDQL
jgi:hypothetical protein